MMEIAGRALWVTIHGRKPNSTKPGAMDHDQHLLYCTSVPQDCLHAFSFLTLFLFSSAPTTPTASVVSVLWRLLLHPFLKTGAGETLVSPRVNLEQLCKVTSALPACAQKCHSADLTDLAH